MKKHYLSLTLISMSSLIRTRTYLSILKVFYACEDLSTADYDDKTIPLDLGLDSINRPRVIVDCTNMEVKHVVHHTLHTCEENKGPFVSSDPPQDIFHTPSERAIDALLDCTLFPPVANSTGGSSTKPVILDTGASMAISPDAEDFVEPPRPLLVPIALGGMARGMMVAGTGIVPGRLRQKTVPKLKYGQTRITFQRRAPGYFPLSVYFVNAPDLSDITLETKTPLS
jgi:hypothetical protein